LANILEEIVVAPFPRSLETEEDEEEEEEEEEVSTYIVFPVIPEVLKVRW
jgi:hypothetical protein